MQKGKAYHILWMQTQRLLRRNKDDDRNKRINDAGELVNEFIKEYGYIPDGESLEQLADFILLDELRDMRRNKSSLHEYPFLSERQLKSRLSWEAPLSEVSWEVDLDGRDRSMPFRKNYREDYLIEAEASVYEEINEKAEVKSYTDYFLANRYANNRDQIGDALWRGDESVKWANAVKDRDDWTCQNPHCKKRVRELHAHHLDAWNHAEDLRYALWNGITLCQKCHREFHISYGFGYNTKEQFDEWVASKGDAENEEI